MRKGNILPIPSTSSGQARFTTLLKLITLRKKSGNVLPIALMAFALVAFIFVLDYSIGNEKWPWSVKTFDTIKTTSITNTSTTVSTVHDQCVTDADCLLDSCGCVSKSYLDANPNLPMCQAYWFPGTTCTCQSQKCTVDTSSVKDTSSSPTADLPAEQAGWKTYTNSRYVASGETYSFRYPEGWKINDFDPQYVRLSPPNQTTNESTTPVTISVDYILVPGEIPVQKIDDPRPVVIDTKTTTQGMLSGTPNQFFAQVPVTNGNLQISWVKNNSSDEIHKQILSTFTFTSPTANLPAGQAGWKTFSNSKYSFQYPTSWFATDCSDSGAAVVVAPINLTTLCGSDFFGGFTVGTVALLKSIADQVAVQKVTLDNPIVSSVTIDGYQGTRLQGAVKKDTEIGAGMATDTIYVEVHDQVYNIANNEGQKESQNFTKFYSRLSWSNVKS